MDQLGILIISIADEGVPVEDPDPSSHVSVFAHSIRGGLGRSVVGIGDNSLRDRLQRLHTIRLSV